MLQKVVLQKVVLQKVVLQKVVLQKVVLNVGWSVAPVTVHKLHQFSVDGISVPVGEA